MATLEKIRNKAGLLVIVVGLALFAFIIGDFLNSGSTYFRQSQERIATINGETISIQDYQARIDEMTEVYKMQTGNSNVPEEVMSQVRQSVFDSMVQEIVMDEEAEKLGMSVSAEELFDMVQGENISPVIQQMPMFANPQTGMFDKTALLNFLKAIDDDNIASYPPEQQSQLLPMRQFWLFWEKSIKQQRLEEKYTNMLSKAISANKLDAQESYNASVNTSNIDYVMQSFSTIPDSLVTVSKSEVEKLYNQRKENYKQAESKVVKYISVDIVPSTEDFEKVSADIESLRNEFMESSNVADIVNENSDVPYLNAFFSENSFDAEMKQFATTAEIGAVEGPIFADNTYRMFKLIDKTVAPDSVKVSHIMLAGASEAQTIALADSLIGELKKGGDFAAMATEFSVDQSAQNGGELGWFTEATAIRGVNEDFKNVVFSAPLNEVNVVKSMYGTHLVKVTEKTANVNKYKMASIQMAVSPSSKTYSNIYNQLNQYISTNNTLAKFEENAQEAGYHLISDATVTTTDQTLGTIRNSRPVIRWAFQNDKGKISEIFEADDKFIVAAVQGTIPEGYRPLNLVSPSLEMELRSQKKGEMIVSNLKAKNLSTLEQYAEAMNTGVNEVSYVGFNTSRISGIGVEPKLNALITLAPVDKLSEPVAGNGGVYVFKVTSKNLDSKEYDEQTQVNTINSANAYRYGFQSIQSLIRKADVEDNRIRFY